MWSTAVQETQVNIEPEDVEQNRDHQETQKPCHTLPHQLHLHTQSVNTHFPSHSSVRKSKDSHD